jgi:hypothetical protein
VSDTSYETFRQALLDRHTNPLTSGLSIVGDALLLSALPAGLAKRSTRVAARTFAVGYTTAAVAHLFQPGTVRAELMAVGRHPIWSSRAEASRIATLLRPRRSSPS